MRRHTLETLAFVGGGPNAPQVELKVLMTAEYGEDQDGVPVPSRVEYVEPMESEPTRERFEFDRVEFDAEIPEREFTLGHYRLPNVTAPPADPARGRAVYWIFGLSSLALVAALVIRKRDQAIPEETS